MCGRAGKFVEVANYIFEMTEMGLVPISRCFDMVTDGLKNCGKHDLAGKVQEWEVSIRGVWCLMSVPLPLFPIYSQLQAQQSSTELNIGPKSLFLCLFSFIYSFCLELQFLISYIWLSIALLNMMNFLSYIVAFRNLLEALVVALVSFWKPLLFSRVTYIT